METSIRKNYKKKYRENNPEKYKLQRRNEKLKSKYGISGKQYDDLLKEQNGKCRCCGEKFKDSKTTHIDFCTERKIVRSLLCVNCNVALGYLKNDHIRAEKLLVYILST